MTTVQRVDRRRGHGQRRAAQAAEAMTSAQGGARRPLRSRQTRWAAALAGWLAARGVRPNQISVASVVFAGLAGGALALGPALGGPWHGALLVAAAAGIQLRLLCNLMDGMVAIEGGLRTKSGEVYNDLPDRVSDALILAGAGYALPWPVWGAALGWAAGLLAVLTAYVRVLGAAAGAGARFEGPMAKPQRMALLTAACLVAAVEVVAGATGPDGRGGYARPAPWTGGGAGTLAAALALIVAGCAATVVRRTRRIVRDLEAQ
jgi:phosphatidylglycerophosphate synthase